MTTAELPTSPPDAVARPPGAATFPLAYVAGTFPLRSETFVYREVRGLRARGWDVRAVSLHDAPAAPPSLADLEAGRETVYGSGRTATLAGAAAELLTHPLRSAATLAAAVGDAIRPGEATSAAGRVKTLGQAFAGLGLARRLRRAGVRHVHCHFAHAPASVGMYAAVQLGVPFSFTGHANDLFQRRAGLRAKLRRAAFVACISRWHRSFYESILPDGSDKYAVVRCGVDVEGWTPREHDDAGERPFRVLTVCRLVEKKGVDTLLRGFDEFRRRSGRECLLIVAGDGPDAGRLKRIADELGCGSSVRWAGAVDNDAVPALLGEADAFALPCRTDAGGDRDGIPVVLMEAMACGVPVVSGDLPAVRELVEDGVGGLLLDGNAPDAAAQTAAKLSALAGDVEWGRRLAAAGRRRVETEFSSAVNLDRLEALFRKSSIRSEP